MVKNVQFTLDDGEYKQIIGKRGNRSWREFLLDVVKGPVDVEEKVREYLTDHGQPSSVEELVRLVKSVSK